MPCFTQAKYSERTIPLLSSPLLKEDCIMQRLYFIRFLKPVLGLMLAIAAAAAFALPSPKDIDAAVSAGHLSQAETMLREVIQQKPQSAKAHYELGQVLARQARYADAEKALLTAKELDPTLKFATSPDKFNDTFDKVARKAKDLTGAQVNSGLSELTRPAAAPAPTSAAAESSFPLHYVWIGIGGLVILALVLRSNKANTATPTQAYAPNYPAGAPSAPGYGSMNPQGYGPGYPQSPAAGSGIGSGIGGAVVGGLAGVAAGYALSKALEGDHHSNPVNAAQNPASDSGYVPFNTPRQPDLGSFDSGSGSGWDDAGSDSGSDDNW
jgi:hypothetical protein